MCLALAFIVLAILLLWPCLNVMKVVLIATLERNINPVCTLNEHRTEIMFLVKAVPGKSTLYGTQLSFCPALGVALVFVRRLASKCALSIQAKDVPRSY